MQNQHLETFTRERRSLDGSGTVGGGGLHAVTADTVADATALETVADATVLGRILSRVLIST